MLCPSVFFHAISRFSLSPRFPPSFSFSPSLPPSHPFSLPPSPSFPYSSPLPPSLFFSLSPSFCCVCAWWCTVCTWLWRPEVNAKCLLQPLSTLCFETESCTDPEAHRFSKLSFGTLLSPPSKHLDCRCSPTYLYFHVAVAGLNSGPQSEHFANRNHCFLPAIRLFMQ